MAGRDFNVAVRLSTVGADQTAAGIKQAGASISDLQQKGEALYGSLLKLAAQFGIGLGIFEVVKQAKDANVELEKMTLTTGALLGAFRPWTGIVGGSAQAMREGAAAAQMLQNAQFGVLGTSGELFRLYQQLIPVMATSGAKGTQQMVDFSVTVAKIADITGQSYEEVGAALSRMITTGEIAARGPLTQFLKNLGITPEQLSSWRQAGTLLEDFGAKLKEATRGQDAMMTSNSALVGQIKKAAESILEEAYRPLFEKQKTFLTNLRDSLVTITPKGTELNKAIVEPLSIAFQTAEIVVSGIARGTADLIVTIWQDGGTNAGKAFSKTLGDTFLRMALFLTETWNTFIRSMIPGIEFVKHPIDAIAALGNELNSELMSATALTLRSIGQIDAAMEMEAARDAFEEWAVKTNKFANGLTNALQTQETWFRRTKQALQDLQNSQNAPAGPGAPTPGWMLAGFPGGPPPKSPQMIQLEEQWDNLKKKLEASLNLAGLEGYQKEIADVEKTFTEMDIEIGKVEKQARQLSDAGVLAATKNFRENVLPAAYVKEQEKVWDESALKYQEAMAKITDSASDSEEARIRAEEQVKLAALASAEKQAWIWGSNEAKKTAAVEARIAAVARVQEEADLKSAANLAKQSGDWQTWARKMAQAAVIGGENVVIATKKYFTEAAANAYAAADTMAQGITAGWLQIESAVKTTGQNVADFMTGTWAAVGKGFETGIYDIITGKAHDLKTVLLSLWDEIAHGFAKMVSGMIQNWIFGQQKIGTFGGVRVDPNMPSGFSATGGQAGFLGTGVPFGGLLGYGLGGYGIGSMIGGGGIANQLGGLLGGVGGGAAFTALGGASGTILGVELGAWAGPIGMIIGAILGAIIGGLFKKSTQEWDTIVGANIGPYATAPNAGGSKVWQAYGSTLGSLGDIMKAGGGKATDILRFMRGGAIPDEFLRSTGITFGAGSPEDKADLFKQYLENFFPKTLFSMAFGRQATGGFEFLPGIGNNLQGLPQFTGGAGDTPLTRMLSTLGFAKDAIDKMAEEIDLRSADDFKKWLGQMVQTMKTFGDLISSATANTDAAAALARGDSSIFPAELTGAAALGDQAAKVVDAFGALQDYVGDDALNRIHDAQSAAAAFFDAQKRYLLTLKALQEGISDSVTGQVRGMKLDLMTDAQKSQFFGTEIQSLLGQLGSAKDAATVQKLFGMISGDVSALWGLPGAHTSAMETWIENVLAQAQRIANQWISGEATAATSPNAELVASINAEKTAFGELHDSLIPLKNSTDELNTAASNASLSVGSFQAATDDARLSVGGLRSDFDSLRAAVSAAKDAIAGLVYAISPNATIEAIRVTPSIVTSATGR